MVHLSGFAIGAPEYQFDFDSLSVESLRGQTDNSPNTIGNWSTGSGVAQVLDGGLTAAAGTNYAISTSGQKYVRITRADTAYRSQFHEIVPFSGGVTWVSVLVQAQSGSAAAVVFDGSNDPGTAGWSLNGRPGFGIRPDAGAGETEIFWSDDLSDLSSNQSLTLPVDYSGETVLLLARIDLSVAGNNVNLWVNPSLVDLNTLGTIGDLGATTTLQAVDWIGIGAVNTGVSGYQVEFDNFLISTDSLEQVAFENVTGLADDSSEFLPNGSVDVNRNGLPDSAEIAFPGLSTRPLTGDADGDGQSNLVEAFAGTDPFDGSSLLKVMEFKETSDSSGNYSFTFTSVPQKRYQIELSETLTAGAWTNFGDDFAASSNTTTVLIPETSLPLSDQFFVRVKVFPEVDSDSDGLEDSLESFLSFDPNESASVRSESAGGDLQQFRNLMMGGNPLGGMEGSNLPGIPSQENASRFLAQASWGARAADIVSLRSFGSNAYEKWIDAQTTIPPSYTEPYMDYLAARRDSDFALDSAGWRDLPHFMTSNSRFAFFRENLNTVWMRNALFGPDQLRQRMTWALSQILVIGPRCNSYARAAASWYDTIHQHSFGNYRDLLYDISVHPWMGWWLSHVGNEKAIRVGTAPDGSPVYQMPDENFAREIMQLFSIGLWELNMDGSRKLDNNGDPIPTYSNEDITQMARVFTGLNFRSGVTGRDIYAAKPMQMLDDRHDQGDATAVEVYGMEEKVILGQTLPTFSANPGRVALDDVSDTIEILINHPNCAPFISRNLIQHLVSSNPTPAYIERVSNVFVDDGTGMRGNLAAVVKAILLDPEARNLSAALHPHAGRLKGPMLRTVSMARYTEAGAETPSLHDDAGIQFWLPKKETLFADYLELPFASPSVFNFYEPEFSRPGEIRELDLLSPEFQITNALTVTTIPNRLLYFIQNGMHDDRWRNPGVTPDFNLKMEPLETLSLSSTEALVDELNLIFSHGHTSAEARAEMIRRVDFYSQNATNSDERAELALYLSLTSPEGAVLK